MRQYCNPCFSDVKVLEIYLLQIVKKKTENLSLILTVVLPHYDTVVNRSNRWRRHSWTWIKRDSRHVTGNQSQRAGYRTSLFQQCPPDDHFRNLESGWWTAELRRVRVVVGPGGVWEFLALELCSTHCTDTGTLAAVVQESLARC